MICERYVIVLIVLKIIHELYQLIKKCRVVDFSKYNLILSKHNKLKKTE